MNNIFLKKNLSFQSISPSLADADRGGSAEQLEFHVLDRVRFCLALLQSLLWEEQRFLVSSFLSNYVYSSLLYIVHRTITTDFESVSNFSRLLNSPVQNKV